MDTSLLKFLVKSKKTIDSITDFCKDNEKFCTENREYICKRVLKISGYKVPKKYKYSCRVYKELVELSTLARNSNRVPIKKSYIESNRHVIREINSHGSIMLRDFFIYNGHLVEFASSKKSSFSIKDLFTL
jgi:hypothetical protein